MKQLTGKQQRVLDFIETYISSNDESPTLFEIKKFLGVKALSTVHQHLRALEDKGYLSRDTNTERGINYVMNAGKFIGEFIKIPMVGTIVAGYPIEAVEEISEYIQVPAGDLKSTQDYIALRVKGDSMIESFILEGDVVIAEKTSAVRDGDMVVALVDNSEATLKYFYKEKSKDEKKHKIKLQPANKNYEPFIYNPGEVEVQGRVVKVVRDYR